MSKPIVAIVGRPNVGKSTLFNALAGENISIVKDTPGVTRDRIYADISWLNYNFTLIDTGGIEPDSGDVILSRMREQAQIAIETADVIIFLVDVRQGLVDADFQVADMLRRSQKPVVLAVNKADNYEKFLPDTYEFYNLGLGDPHPVSANSKLGFGDLLDEVVENCDPKALEEEEDERRESLYRMLRERREMPLTRSSRRTEKNTCLLTPQGSAGKIKSKKIWNVTVSSVQFPQWNGVMWRFWSLTPQKASPSRTQRSQALPMREARG